MIRDIERPELQKIKKIHIQYIQHRSYKQKKKENVMSTLHESLRKDEPFVSKVMQLLTLIVDVMDKSTDIQVFIEKHEKIESEDDVLYVAVMHCITLFKQLLPLFSCSFLENKNDWVCPLIEMLINPVFCHEHFYDVCIDILIQAIPYFQNEIQYYYHIHKKDQQQKGYQILQSYQLIVELIISIINDHNNIFSCNQFDIEPCGQSNNNINDNNTFRMISLWGVFVVINSLFVNNRDYALQFTQPLLDIITRSLANEQPLIRIHAFKQWKYFVWAFTRADDHYTVRKQNYCELFIKPILHCLRCDPSIDVKIQALDAWCYVIQIICQSNTMFASVISRRPHSNTNTNTDTCESIVYELDIKPIIYLALDFKDKQLWSYINVILMHLLYTKIRNKNALKINSKHLSFKFNSSLSLSFNDYLFADDNNNSNGNNNGSNNNNDNNFIFSPLQLLQVVGHKNININSSITCFEIKSKNWIFCLQDFVQFVICGCRTYKNLTSIRIAIMLIITFFETCKNLEEDDKDNINTIINMIITIIPMFGNNDDVIYNQPLKTKLLMYLNCILLHFWDCISNHNLSKDISNYIVDFINHHNNSNYPNFSLFILQLWHHHCKQSNIYPFTVLDSNQLINPNEMSFQAQYSILQENIQYVMHIWDYLKVMPLEFNDNNNGSDNDSNHSSNHHYFDLNYSYDDTIDINVIQAINFPVQHLKTIIIIIQQICQHILYLLSVDNKRQLLQDQIFLLNQNIIQCIFQIFIQLTQKIADNNNNNNLVIIFEPIIIELSQQIQSLIHQIKENHNVDIGTDIDVDIPYVCSLCAEIVQFQKIIIPNRQKKK
ncbi:RasGEF domain-containing protein [Reticulomyxa filosa]|uniref:RasGEF domain-containing protein n=1 Tax=Reticulomyxa filosa TaxID=46433 RepID=X6MRD4_RETFI|nr:RasGEF domain-containing protein [Reticulomyxa filosa]|eukprot:ETO15997.1 RasGEF domain-containing protein [Reticulomyxa filosa]